MKQIIQDMKNGATVLAEVPSPQVKTGSILIQTTRTLVSLGTERMLVEFGRSSLIEKARQQPDKVKQVLDKIKTDGLLPTLEAVFNKLGQPLPLGYCNVGKVIAVGKGVSEFSIGDRVASNGNHAEFVCVPSNLAVKIPDPVSDEEATFTVIGSIGLQGLRLLMPQLGETVAVIGLGLIGLVAAQLLKANGCRVIGIDFDAGKLAVARKFGIITCNPNTDGDPVATVEELTDGVGADGVLITASAKSDEIMHQACEMSRKRGRIVLVGVVGLGLRRDDFYKKELSFQVSCSYGPGRYDENYESKGQDYPLPFVRWTEKRNFDAILQAMASGALDVKSLITEVVALENYQEIYGDMRKAGAIASLLKFSESSEPVRKITITERHASSGGKLGIIGAGNFTGATVLPALKKIGCHPEYIASANGLSAATLARKYAIRYASSDYRDILADPEVRMVMITTRHNLHAPMILESLRAGKSVFVEKPLCLKNEELDEIVKTLSEAPAEVTLTVGFNRRFSPLAVKMHSLLGGGMMNIVATMNAGFIPADVWVHDPDIGGGRVIGEACHLIDFCSFLAGSEVQEVCMNAMGKHPQENCDNVSILLRYRNGSQAVVNYFANGAKSYAKEKFEVFSQGKILTLDNWRLLTGYGFHGFSKLKSQMDKGHYRQFLLLNEQLQKGGAALIPFDEIVNTTKAALACIESMKLRSWVSLD